MTDKERVVLLNRAVRRLKNTKQGYNPNGSEWKAAMADLRKLLDDLKPDVIKVPDLGPLHKGARPILQYQLTHRTSGLKPERGEYIALDDAFTEGKEIMAPEDIEVSEPTESNPGLGFFAIGESWLKYCFFHLDRTQPAGKNFKKGQVVGRVCKNNIGGGPHVHLGINIEAIAGRDKQLLYGETGKGPNYTFGSPILRVQLAKILKEGAGQ